MSESLDDAAEFMHERMDLSFVETMSLMLISFTEIPGSGLFKTFSGKGCEHHRLVATQASPLGSSMMKVA